MLSDLGLQNHYLCFYLFISLMCVCGLQMLVVIVDNKSFWDILFPVSKSGNGLHD